MMPVVTQRPKPILSATKPPTSGRKYTNARNTAYHVPATACDHPKFSIRNRVKTASIV